MVLQGEAQQGIRIVVILRTRVFLVPRGEVKYLKYCSLNGDDEVKANTKAQPGPPPSRPTSRSRTEMFQTFDGAANR
jgi:hypothetical protein